MMTVELAVSGEPDLITGLHVDILIINRQRYLQTRISSTPKQLCIFH